MVEAFTECIADAGIEKDRIEAAWLSTAIESVHVGSSGCLSRSPCAFPTSR